MGQTSNTCFWSSSTGGVWSASSNWNSTPILDLTNSSSGLFTVCFSASTGTLITTVDEPSSLFRMRFDPGAGDWLVDGSGPLVLRGGVSVNSGSITLAGTLPVIIGSPNVWNISSGASLTINGPMLNNQGLTLRGGGNLNFNGILSGSGGLRSFTTGTIALSTANRFTGTSTIAAGSLLLNNRLAAQNSTVELIGTGNLDFGSLSSATLGGLSGTRNISTAGILNLRVGQNNASTFYNAALAGSGLSLAKVGTGTLTLSQQQNYGGSTSVLGGALNLNFAGGIGSASNLLSPTSNLNLASATLNLNGRAGQTNSQTFGGLTLSGGGTISMQSGVGGVLNANIGAITRDTGSTINFALPASGSITTSQANENGTILGGWATVNGNTWGVTGSGIVSGLSAYSSAYASGGDIDAPSGPMSLNTTTINSLRFNAAAATQLTINAGQTLSITSGGILHTSTTANNQTAIVDSGGQLTSGASSLYLQTFNTFDLNASADAALAISGTIVGPINLVKSGPGIAFLDNTANTFGGSGHAIYLNAGGLRTAPGDGALGHSSNKVVLRGGALIWTGTTTTDRTFELGEGDNVFGFSGAPGLITVNGPITGTGSIRIAGSANAIIFANTANNFTGNIILGGARRDGGATGDFSLRVDSDLVLGNLANGVIFQSPGSGASLSIVGTTFNSTNRSLTLNPSATGTIDIQSTANNFTWNGPISGTGTLTKSGVANILTLAGDYGSFTGGISLLTAAGSSSQLRLNGISGASFGTLTLGANTIFDLNDRVVFVSNIANSSTGSIVLGSGTLILRNGGSGTSAFTIQGTGNLVKQGSSLQGISGNSAYTGTTSIDGGEFALDGAAGKLSGTSAIAIRGGGVLRNGSTTLSFNLAATVRVNPTSSITLGDSLLGGGTYRIVPSMSTLTQSHTSLTVGSGYNSIEKTTATLTGTPNDFTLRFTGSLTRSPAGILNITRSANFGQSPGLGGVKFDSALPLTNGLIGGWAVTNSATGFNFLTTQASYLVPLGAASEVSVNSTTNGDPNAWNVGASPITAASNIVFDASELNSTTALLTGSAAVYSIRVLNSASNAVLLDLASGAELTIGSGAIIYDPLAPGSTTRNINGGVLKTLTGELLLGITNGNLAISSQIIAGSVVKYGSNGTLTLSNAANQFGDLYALGGTVASAGTASLGTSPGTIYLLGGSLQLTTTSQTYANKSIVVGPQNSSIVLSGSGITSAAFNSQTVQLIGTLSLAGGATPNQIAIGSRITGPGAITTMGLTLPALSSFQIDLNAPNDFFGGVTLSNTGAGSLILGLGNDSALGSGNLAIMSPITLVANGGPRTISNSVVLNANATIGGINALTFQGPFALGAAVTSLTTTNSELTSITGSISEPPLAGRSLIKSGSGRLRLSGLNAYTGFTTISQGTLLVGTDSPHAAAGALGNAGSNVVLTDSSTGAADVALLTDGAFTIGRSILVGSNGSGMVTLGGNAPAASLFTGSITLSKNVTFNQVTDGRTTFTGPIADVSSSNDVAIAGGGKIVFSASASYGGTTTINSGSTLLINGIKSGSGSIQVDGTLGGNGEVAGNIAVGSTGFISPGDGVGALTLSGNTTFASGGRLRIEIGGTTPASGYDQLMIDNTTGSIDLLGADFDGGLLNGFAPSNSDRFFIVVNKGSAPPNGVLNQFNSGSQVVFGGYQFDVSYTGNFSTMLINGGNDVVLYNATAVPEPACALLVAIIGFVLFRFVRTKNRLKAELQRKRFSLEFRL